MSGQNYNVLRRLMFALTDGGSFALSSGDVLLVKPVADDTGSINIGDGTTDMDVKWFGGASTQTVLFDVGNTIVTFEDVDLHMGDNDAVELGDATGGDVRLLWNGTHLQGGPSSDFWTTAPSKADPQDDFRVIRVFDDMLGGPVPSTTVPTSNGCFLAIHDGASGTNAYRTDTAGGVLNVLTAAADNDYQAIVSSIGSFDFLAAKETWLFCRFRLAEANTNESAIWFGITSDLTTGGLQANALGPLATYDGVMMWKNEGTMQIQAETSNAGTQDTEATVATFVTNTWTTLAMHIDATATTAVMTAYYNVAAGTALTAHGTTMNLTRAGLVPGALVLGVKAGPTAGAETLQVDYIGGYQVR